MSETDNPEVQPLDPEPMPPDHTLLPPGPVEAPSTPASWTAPLQPAPSNSFWSRIAAAAVMVAVVAAAAGAGIGWSVARSLDSHRSAQSITQPESPIQAQNPVGGSSQSGGSVPSAAAKVIPAVVDINTVVGSSSGAGTGMIISSSGEVLTNHHVVAQSTSIRVTIPGRSQAYNAHVIGVDPSADVALIQIDGVSGLPTVKLASSASLSVGDSIVALGNALGAGGTPRATSGSITALDQTITASEGGGQTEDLTGMIQSDADIYPGDSGGPIVNSAGQVVGMITAGQPQRFRSSASNIGYAIPSDTALGIVNRLRAREQASDLAYGQIGYLGVSVQTLDAGIAAKLGLSVSSGVLVSGVVSGSPADGAGLSQYSVITEVEGVSITTSESLGTAIKARQAGDRLSLKWVAQDGTHTSTVTLAGINP
jgi:S1-C subfamily serine protease